MVILEKRGELLLLRMMITIMLLNISALESRPVMLHHSSQIKPVGIGIERARARTTTKANSAQGNVFSADKRVVPACPDPLHNR